MKRPAHMTLVDADRYSALVSRCTEQRERAEKAEARSEALEFDRDFWHGWAVKVEPRLGFLAVGQHITAEDIERVAALAKEKP